VVLRKSEATDVEWWEIQGDHPTIAEDPFPPEPIYVFSTSRSLSGTLNYGLIGVYLTFVITIGRFVRYAVVGMSKNIIYEDVANPDYFIRLCQDIYMARLQKHLALEEQLYVELINLLRSPETIIERTGEYRHHWQALPVAPDSQSSSSNPNSSSHSDTVTEADRDGQLLSLSRSNSPLSRQRHSQDHPVASREDSGSSELDHGENQNLNNNAVRRRPSFRRTHRRNSS